MEIGILKAILNDDGSLFRELRCGKRARREAANESKAGIGGERVSGNRRIIRKIGSVLQDGVLRAVKWRDALRSGNYDASLRRRGI